ncbi:MAG TPA: FAD-dependent oxidoreductase [Bacteroidetes bacterium]|nr:FAD-dependent oxidoreductase [Bacteroidota bacterium]
MSRHQQSRTELLRSLRKAFQLAVLSQKKNSPPVDELADMISQPRSASRRNFLSNTAKAGLVFGAAGLINACKKGSDALMETAGINGMKNESCNMNIVIVGAGMAGLNCCYQLKKQGIGSKVYEASTRVGGRIFTASNIMAPGLTTELGGEFIDSIHTDMIHLAQEFNLPLIDTFAPSETSLVYQDYFFNGQHYSLQEVIDAFLPYASQIQSDINSLPNVIVYNNYGNADFYDNQSISQYFDSIGMTGWIREALEVAYLTEYGREVDDQSAINFLYLFSPDTSAGTFDIFGESDERYKISGGNQLVINKIYEQVQTSVTLERKLVKLSKLANNTYKLWFEKPNGTTIQITADAVVLTLPFTILRTVDLSGVTLPSWKTNAIQNLGYGTNAKLMLGFNSRYWRSQGYTGYNFSDTGMQTGWDNSELQGGIKGGYTVFLGGNLGIDLGSGTAESQKNIYLPKLEQIWNGISSQYNGNVQRMQWPSQPYTLGSYACYRPGQFQTICGAERKEVGNLFFAGEHCSLNFQGYMNGAAETGKRAASKIIETLCGGGGRVEEEAEGKVMQY